MIVSMEHNTDSHAVVRALWERMEARDWAGVSELLDRDLVLDWPQSGERIPGADRFVAVNREYPGEWHISVQRVVAAGSDAVTEVEVRFADAPERIDRAVSFFVVRDGRITAIREFWPDPFPPAPWRAQWVERAEATR